MASPKISKLLAEAKAKGPDDQEAALDHLLVNIQSFSSPSSLSADINALADAIFANGLRIVAQAKLIERLSLVLKHFARTDLTVPVAEHTLALLASQQQSATFLAQEASLRDLLAGAHEANEDFLEATKVLAAVNLDSAQRNVTNEERVEIWVRIVRDYLEVDDTTSAETYLNKLKNVIYTVSDTALNLHFSLSQARIQDAKHEFLAASQAYHNLSFSTVITDEERLRSLGPAARCAILAPAGPLRSRALGRLYKDERVVTLDEFPMLENMFLDRLITPAEVDKFAQRLADHQKATTSDGSTVLAKAVVEHNLLAASRLYSNISFDALAGLLGLDAERAEDTTAKMIEQGRLVGRIDQIEQVIWFERGEASGEKGSGRAEVTVGREMRRWDANVQGLAEEVENVTNALQREFPDFVAANLAAV
ncbi:COP9 signalosome complex subunit 4 [Xylariaceae sp. FL1019]|nr:COP9 signalosome complex subunit 4 [Xylariaceae sp. FL1019]